ncbi:MAG: hypothetical protein Q4G24_05540 [Paracoccus sp. (in: a-proteobacteria)]|uniref:dioxygenase family protein n=1 Tax=Paracoccus sp. TaxID=267 RepID=UPI0026DF1B86|nr:hypothetical protein [Paracoccus sp. (in: a-proteobacteria)]MDO5620916.1 hypothetical protein [Paracoccus sp. (in: a-proteobacteria)]
MTNHHDNEGFAHDLPALIGRRGLLALLGAGAVSLSAPARALASCVALPWETAGPYPADGSNSRSGQVINVLTEAGVIRDDLRASFNGKSGVAEGVPLVLELTLLNADGCTPLAGHAVYLWHCDATGLYSLYDLPDQNFLRGVAVTDDQGKLRVTTIVPGCYDGRWPHIHFEVFETAEAAVSGQASLLTAQIALPQDQAAAVYAQDAHYSNGTANLARITIPTDNVFGDNTEAQITQQTLVMQGDTQSGYLGTVTVPVDFNADRTVQMAPPPGGMPPGGPGNPPPGSKPPSN